MISKGMVEYKAKRRKRIEEIEINKDLFKIGSKDFELHHIISKNNSDIKISLCKFCHNFITTKQNSLSVKERKNKRLLARISARALVELGINFLRILDENDIENGK